MVNVNEKIKWTDGESMFSWWMQDHKSKDDHDQTVMFE
jgi:hypothetical protein